MRTVFIFFGLAGFLSLAGVARAKKESGASSQAALTGGEPRDPEPAVSPAPPHPVTRPVAATNPAPVAPLSAPAALPGVPATNAPAVANRVATLTTADLRGYSEQPSAVREVIAAGLALTTLNLAYTYGSADPKNGGMDCSGTIYYLLRQAGLPEVPRDASGMYKWVWQEGGFQAVVSTNPGTFELARLKPGDLLFWTGTYQVERDPPVTHVMLYLGTRVQDGRRVMLGASEGRTFDGKARYGVSVFDFKLPGAVKNSATPEGPARFIGYGPIPGLEKGDVPVPAKETPAPPPVAPGV